MKGTSIQWTTHTFSPWWGCTRIGPGCGMLEGPWKGGGCYAQVIDKRHHYIGNPKGTQPHWGDGASQLLVTSSTWKNPDKWERDARESGEVIRVFCGSMCDVFDNRAKWEWRQDLWDVIWRTPSLRWQLLSKRIGNAPSMLPPDWPTGFEHVGLMSSTELQGIMEREVPKLMEIPATWHGLSVEPLLEEVDVRPAIKQGIDWIIVGGESGPRSRPFHLEWARKIVRQCEKAGVACFVKQVGHNAYLDGKPFITEDSHGGDWDEWPADLRVRQFPAALSSKSVD